MKGRVDCNLIVLGTNVLLETTCSRCYGLEVFKVDDGFQRKVLDYLRDNPEINIVNKSSFSFLTL